MPSGGQVSRRCCRESCTSAFRSSIQLTFWRRSRPPQLAIVHYLSLAMSFLGLLGIVGLYVRQADETGWLGLAGCLFFSLFYACAIGFQFVEAFISPVLAAQAPQVVEGLLGIVNGHATETNLAPLPAVWSATRVCCLLGGALF